MAMEITKDKVSRVRQQAGWFQTNRFFELAVQKEKLDKHRRRGASGQADMSG
jgi:hypothetical protein